MKRKSIRQVAMDPCHIPGIYNYCDRWCERCTFTSRCLVFAMEREDDDPAARDLRNQAFWRKLESIFRETREMLTEWAESEGIDLEALDVPAADDMRRRRDEVQDDALARAARYYAEVVDQWLAAELTPIEQVGYSSANVSSEQDEPESVGEAVEVIRWYQHQIGAKIVRGLSGTESAREPDDYQSDSDGSAKVALIGLDRSIGAWGVLRGCLPEKVDGIRAILQHLERLRRTVEQTFPNARSFVRPGFDSIPSQQLH
jgi:hypothetical protein